MCCTLKTDRVLLVGTGGHCGVIVDSLRRINPDISIGLVAKHAADSCNIHAPVVGQDEDLPQLLAQGWTHAFVSVGSIGTIRIRELLTNHLKELGFHLPIIVDPTAVVSDHAILEEGTFVGAGAIIQTNARIGTSCIINTAAVVEHDCTLEGFVHMSPGSVLCGQVHVGYGTHIGARAVVKQGVSIGKNTVIGMGSVVTKEIPDGVVAYGCPCAIQHASSERNQS